MTDFNDKLATQWNDASNLVLGVWLAISPWVLSYASHTAAAWNAHAVGVIVAVAAIAALISFQKWEEWVNTALGAWLVSRRGRAEDHSISTYQSCLSASGSVVPWM